VPVGSVLDGRYRVERFLARGGMATVYVATDLRLDRVVALKVMHPHLAHDQAFVSRFQREAKAAARLTHGHVVGVYDQGSDGDHVYLAMEYVPGRTLRDVMRDFGPLSPEQALVLLDPVLEALAAAHAAGFVHRDIKPENVLISDDGRVKVADFGLARAMESSEQSITHGVIIGTVAYLSPEQVERGEADGRSDLYAAGILLFEMITGQLPHAGESPLSVAYQHVHTDVPAPSTLNPAIPSEVDALVVTATRRDPRVRYQDAADFLADVRRIRATLPPPRPFVDARDTLVVDLSPMRDAPAPVTAPLAVPLTSPGAAPGTSPSRAQGATQGTAPRSSRPDSSATSPGSRRRRSRGPIVAVIVLLAVLGAALSAWWLAAGPGRTMPTPDVTGLTVEEATSALSTVGLSLQVSGEAFSESVPAGALASTDPLPGDPVRVDGTVVGAVSLGPERYEVPIVKGLDPTEAAAAITSANLVLGATREDFDDRVPIGDVASSTPKAGSIVKPGTVVDIVISKGPEPVPVPDVEGRKSALAKMALTEVGLKADVTQKFSEKVKDGIVISIRPRAGTIVDSGSSVALIVSKGPPPVTVPNLVDMPRDRAVATLRGLGLRAKIVEGDFSPLNRVISQTPTPGSSVPKGSTVTIRII
jgi:beta-lactam-binding protein with PASTA domain/serine/threonine protein kinase